MGCGSSKPKEVSRPESKVPAASVNAQVRPAESQPARPAVPKPNPPPAATGKNPVTAGPKSLVQNKLSPITDSYEFLETLGSGAFAEVKKATYKVTGDTRAVKVIHKAGLDSASLDPKHKLREIKVLQELDHPNILRVHELYEEKSRYYIVMEFCEGGDLFSRLQKLRRFSEVQVGKIMFQLLSAVSYCHKKFVIHRDLKPENILLEDKQELTIRIADFGSSSYIDPKKKLSGVHGSAYYVAPEVLKEAYNEKCDVWSCGIILYILLTGRPPYTGRNEKEILAAVYEGDLDISALYTVSPEARDLTNQMLNKNFRLRISAAEALQHQFITKNRQADASSGAELTSVLSSMKAFNGASKLKDAIHTFIATQIATQADLKDLREAFQAIDRNGDGKVSREELLAKYRETMPAASAEREVAEIMSQVDTDQSGFIDYTEFLKASLDKSRHLSQHNLDTTFNLFDKDCSGKISASELRSMLQGSDVADEARWVQLIKEVDENGDGEIDLMEFKKLVLTQLQ